MQLERIYVEAKFQGRKIGQWMLEEVFSLAEKEKVAYLWLGVWSKNVRAIQFYERSGFFIHIHRFCNHRDCQEPRT